MPKVIESVDPVVTVDRFLTLKRAEAIEIEIIEIYEVVAEDLQRALTFS